MIRSQINMEKRKEIDKYQCQICGKRTGLHVHHIKSVSQCGSNELENLITVCSSCHRSLESGSIKRAVLKCVARALNNEKVISSDYKKTINLKKPYAIKLKRIEIKSKKSLPIKIERDQREETSTFCSCCQKIISKKNALAFRNLYFCNTKCKIRWEFRLQDSFIKDLKEKDLPIPDDLIEGISPTMKAIRNKINSGVIIAEALNDLEWLKELKRGAK